MKKRQLEEDVPWGFGEVDYFNFIQVEVRCHWDTGERDSIGG